MCKINGFLVWRQITFQVLFFCRSTNTTPFSPACPRSSAWPSLVSSTPFFFLRVSRTLNTATVQRYVFIAVPPRDAQTLRVQLWKPRHLKKPFFVRDLCVRKPCLLFRVRTALVHSWSSENMEYSPERQLLHTFKQIWRNWFTYVVDQIMKMSPCFFLPRRHNALFIWY